MAVYRLRTFDPLGGRAEHDQFSQDLFLALSHVPSLGARLQAMTYLNGVVDITLSTTIDPEQAAHLNLTLVI